MGQYYKGEKIGTCELMYYMTLDEALELSEKGEKDDDGCSFKEYLNDDVTKWRFPFPNEQEKRINREPFRTFNIPSGNIEVNHSRITFHNTHVGGGYGINIFIPCPHSKDFNLETSDGGAGEQFLQVKFEALREGKRKTIFDCSRCNQLQRFSDEDVIEIKARASQYYSVYERSDERMYKYAMEIISKIK